MNEQDSYIKQCNHYCRKDNKKAALSITDKATWDNQSLYKNYKILFLLNCIKQAFSTFEWVSKKGKLGSYLFSVVEEIGYYSPNYRCFKSSVFTSRCFNIFQGRTA